MAITCLQVHCRRAFVLSAEFARGTLYGFTTSSQVITIDTATGVGTVLSNETPQGVKVFAAAP
jgi:hypothetical protein